MKAFYIMTNRPEGLFYHGTTKSLTRRSGQHAGDLFGGSTFCRQYGIDQLVYFELFEIDGDALRREWTVKRWRRAWKLKLINEFNPTWRDLRAELINNLPFEMLDKR